MKQILYISKKDLRHFWREIAISLAVVAVFAWIGPKLWQDASHYGTSRDIRGSYGLPLIELLLLMLIPISWWLFIARVVHEERLVGDRQFWITRPYEWHKLFAAKVLTVACFVYLPLAAAQWWLLQTAGLHPASHIGALLYDWMLITAIFILPIAAIAAVTRNFARMTLTLLGVLVAVAAIAAITSALLQKGVVHSPVDRITTLDNPLLLVICSIVVLLAYARRRIALGRILLLVLPVLLLLSQAFLSSDAMVNRAYPAGNAGIQFTQRNDPMSYESAHPALSRKELLIQVPLHATGIAPGELWISTGAKATVESGGRALWTSRWEPVFIGYLTADSNTTIPIDVSREIFYRVQSQPVTLHVELALDQAHRAQAETVQASLRDTPVNGLGVCSSMIVPGGIDAVTGKTSLQIVGLNCRSALRDPELTYVETAWTDGPCERSKSAIYEFPPQTSLRSAWIGSLNDEPSSLSIAPLEVTPLNFLGPSDYGRNQQPSEIPQICPGAPITFTRYSLVRQLRTGFTIDNFRFPSYDTREDGER